jgi:hypothetical protein
VSEYLSNWNQLLQHLGFFTLRPLVSDIYHWRWHTFSIFSVHYFYERLDFGGAISIEFDIVGNSKILFKIKIFMLVKKNN